MIKCPKCKNGERLSTINTTVEENKYVYPKVSRTYWLCQNCGYRFRNINDLNEEVNRAKNRPAIFIFMAIIGLVVTILMSAILTKMGENDNIFVTSSSAYKGFSIFFVVLFAVGFFIMIQGVMGFLINRKILAKLEKEREESESCFTF